MFDRHRRWTSAIAGFCFVLAHAGADADERTPPAEVTRKSSRDAKSKTVVKFPKFVKADRYWRTRLQPNQYFVTRQKATEPAFSGIYWNHHEDGGYACIGCGTFLFDSEAKFDSGTGWPSYWRPVSRSFLKTKPDFAGGVIRTEVTCRVCEAHLGHVFNDGPRPTGLRFCINSASLHFVPREEVPDHITEWRKVMGLPPLEPEKKADGANSPESKTTDGTPSDSELPDGASRSESSDATTPPDKGSDL